MEKWRINLSTLIIIPILIVSGCSIQKRNSSMSPLQDAKYKEVDSLMDRTLFASAKKVALQIREQAIQNKDLPNKIKSQVILMDIDALHDDNGRMQRFAKSDSLIASTTGIEKAIWQSIQAKNIWTHYQSNRWQILGRTPLQDTAGDTEMDTWNINRYFEKITELYNASLTDAKTLQHTRLDPLEPLLIPGKGTRALRPTLYDLLAFRAIDFFSQSEAAITQPAFQFQLNDPAYFGPASEFSQLDLSSQDERSQLARSLELYQEILAFHLQDKKPDAWIDADLQRLSFVHERSVLPDKDSLYLQALQRLQLKIAELPSQPSAAASAEIAFRILQHEYQNEEKDHRESRKSLEELIAQYPNTQGASNAAELLRSIMTTELNLQAEQVLIPHETSKALVTYRNISEIRIFIYKTPVTGKHERFDIYDEKNRAQLLKMTPLHTWNQKLPASEDHKTHQVEIPLEKLPAGRYYLIASSDENLQQAPSTSLSFLDIQVSNLAVLEGNFENENLIFVLNRKSGLPEKNVQIQLFSHDEKYNNSIYETRTDQDGKATISPNEKTAHTIRNYYNYRVLLTQDTDSLWIDNANPYYRHNQVSAGSEVETQTFLFTDRSIYRPGQTVYFKGIVVHSADKGLKNQVVAGKKTSVKFMDANSQQISEQSVTTNDYGSFEGSFVAPTAGLTGMMSLASEKNTIHFHVEEYKRPGFFVEWKKIDGSYSLHDPIKVTGKAEAYAGNPIDRAAVSYRIVRTARFPYPWLRFRSVFPSSPQMEIVSGTTQTDASGNFEVTFESLPDPNISKDLAPVFTYRMQADVTDINGETHSQTQYIHIGYNSMQLSATVPSQLDGSQTQQILVITQNLQNNFLPANVEMTISALEFPGKIYRKRLWEKPDQQQLSEAEFRSLFPDDEYAEESNPEQWKEKSTVFHKAFESTPDGAVTLPKNTLKDQGWHVVTFKTKDPNGTDIVDKQYVYVVRRGEKSPVQTDLLVSGPEKSLSPGEVLEFQVQTGHTGTYLLESNISMTRTSPTWKFSREDLTIRRKIEERDRGGMLYTWSYIYNNRVYQQQKMVEVPWDNRDLQVEWATHRDQLLPGEKETWSLIIKGSKKEKVATELLASMYDTSLDAFAQANWHWSRLSPVISHVRHQLNPKTFRVTYGQTWTTPPALTGEWDRNIDRSYDELFEYATSPYGRYGNRYFRQGVAAKSDVVMEVAPPSVESLKLSETPSDLESTVTTGTVDAPDFPIRTNLRETAFFLPQLKTDRQGQVKFEFTIPEALTTWKLRAFAHTKDWKTGYLEGKVQTRKELMVVPNLPRFLRQGDQITISTRINNLSDKSLQGKAFLVIRNALTHEIITSAWTATPDAEASSEAAEQDFSTVVGGSAVANWTIRVPADFATPIEIQISAKAGNFTDGESNTLPVVTNRMLVTETLPLPVRGSDRAHFDFTRLKEQNSPTLVNHALTLEFTGNPAWYAVQALPALTETKTENSDGVFNRFYAYALASNIVEKTPKIKEILELWSADSGNDAPLLSNLQKNTELKTALLEETPWVIDATSEESQKRNLKQLFDKNALTTNFAQNLQLLAALQQSDGGFPWFTGMRSSPFITQYILSGLARLQHLQLAATQDFTVQAIFDKALSYLDQWILDDYNRLKINSTQLNSNHTSASQIQYLFLRSYFKNRPVAAKFQESFAYYSDQIKKYWFDFNPYLKGQIALTLHRTGETATALEVLESLRQSSTSHPELGQYWPSMTAGFSWFQRPIEAQSLLIETFTELGADASEINALKIWLIKQKQVQQWETPKATADAVYALLIHGSDWLNSTPEIQIHIGDQTINSASEKSQAGTGYLKKRFAPEKISPSMGDIDVKVTQNQNQVAWGAIYWQYFEDLDKISKAETPLNLRKQLFVRKNSDRGPVLQEIGLTASDGHNLRVGDQVVVRLVLTSDRDLEFVHLKDTRAAGLEPVDVISGYRFQDGLGYYQSTRDLSTQFFFDNLWKGTYVFEYTVTVQQAGEFSNGIATIQSMYAPEFSSHSEGFRISVKP